MLLLNTINEFSWLFWFDLDINISEIGEIKCP